MSSTRQQVPIKNSAQCGTPKAPEAITEAANSEDITNVLRSWSSRDSAYLTAALLSSAQVPKSSTNPPSCGDHFEDLLPPADQKAYARYVHSSGKLRKECVDPYPYMVKQTRELRAQISSTLSA